MPGWLLFVISGILAGGIPGFCIELCCFLHPLNWPLVFLLWFFVLLPVWGLYHHGTQAVIMHESPLLVAIPLLGFFLVVLFLLLFWLVAGFLLFVFVCVVCFSVSVGCLCFWFSCWDCILDCVQVHYQYFCGYRQLTALHDNLNSSFASMNVCNDLAEAMKALDGKKEESGVYSGFPG